METLNQKLSSRFHANPLFSAFFAVSAVNMRSLNCRDAKNERGSYSNPLVTPLIRIALPLSCRVAETPSLRIALPIRVLRVPPLAQKLCEQSLGAPPASIWEAR